MCIHGQGAHPCIFPASSAQPRALKAVNPRVSPGIRGCPGSTSCTELGLRPAASLLSAAPPLLPLASPAWHSLDGSWHPRPGKPWHRCWCCSWWRRTAQAAGDEQHSPVPGIDGSWSSSARHPAPLTALSRFHSLRNLKPLRILSPCKYRHRWQQSARTRNPTAEEKHLIHKTP